MANTIVEYLKQQRASFADAPLSDVDSLVFSTIAYFVFEKGVIGRTVPSQRVPLPVAVCGISHDDLYGRIWLERMNGDEFLAALLTSPRFMSLDVGFYASEVSTHFEKQFSAITFFLPDESAYVAYRGTDNTLAGWKEDFNLTYMKEVPSQVRARTYLEDVAGAGVRRLFVGGHSKGGNLAEYATLTCLQPTFQKVQRVFSHDGPGFAFPPSERMRSDEYAAKLSKTVPECSIFGMLMEDRASYRVVKSSGALFAQHATTHWEVEDGAFVAVDAISPEAAIIAGTLNSWAELYEPDKRECFIDVVFDILGASNADTWRQFAADPSGSAWAVAEATMQLPAGMRSTVLGMFRDIAPVMASEAAKVALPRRS